MTKHCWERVGLVCCDIAMTVWGADLMGRGFGGGFLPHFWGQWWGGSGGVLLHGQSGGPPLWVSLMGIHH